MHDKEVRLFSLLQRFCEASAIGVALLGCLVLLGWAFHIQALISVLPGLVSMKVNTALSLSLAGASLWLLLPEEPGPNRLRAGVFLGVLVALIGAATLSEYIFGLNAGIDQLIFADTGASVGTASPGRMAPNTASALIAIGMALVLSILRSEVARRLSQLLSLGSGLLATMAIAGFIYHATVPNRILMYSRMAVHTAIALVPLSVAIFFARPRTAIARDLTGAGLGSITARRFLPAIVGIPLLLGWVCLSGQYAGLYGTELDLTLFATADIVIFGVLIWWNALKLNAESAQRGRAELELRELNADLEQRIHDRTKSLELQSKEMAHAAGHDYLTGLPNRLLLSERIDHAIASARRHRNKLAVLYLDLDGFKRINDALGHQVGDQVLQAVAGRLLQCVRSVDTVSRQGGDEFLMLVSEIDHPDGSANVAARILKALAVPHILGAREVHVNASIGVSIFPDDGLDAETLMKCADIAMYQSKQLGRRGYQFFTPAMNARVVERQSIEENLRHALDTGEFTLQYQPKVNLETGRIAGAEALLHWIHPVRGLISSADFISIAEDCGLILPIGSWILREACQQARAWACAGLQPMTVAVNVSALQFRDRNFLEDIFQTLNETGLEPGYLELEVTESVLMKRVEFSGPILRTLRERGIRVTIDDFGTGYSILGYLQRFPVDALKIDQSFVRQLATTPKETSIVRALIGMGKSLNLRVIAEGVETSENLAFLRAHRCDEAQGHFLSRPLPPREFAQLLSEGAFLFADQPPPFLSLAVPH